MRDQITFEIVKKGTPEFQSLQSFAESFDHILTDRSIAPVILVSKGGMPIAYFQVIHGPVIMPSFHPGVSSPRTFVEVVERVRSYLWLNSMGDLWPNGVAWTTFDKNPLIPREQIEKLGFRSTNGELWQSYPGIEELD